MMMLTATEFDQTEYGILGVCDDFSKYLMNLKSDRFLHEERNLACLFEDSPPSSYPSSICDDPEIPIFDDEIFERLQPIAPAEPCSPVKKPIRRTEEIRKERVKSTLRFKTEKQTVNKEKNKLNTSEKWTSLSRTSQRDKLQSLMETVTTQLELRKQRKAVRIINPNANTNDEEVYIDLKIMTDTKFDLLNDYVQRQLRKNKRLKEKQRSKTNPYEKSRIRFGKESHRKKEIFFQKEQVITVKSQDIHACAKDHDDEEEEIDILS